MNQALPGRYAVYIHMLRVACAGRGACVDALPYAYLHRQAGRGESAPTCCRRKVTTVITTHGPALLVTALAVDTV